MRASQVTPYQHPEGSTTPYIVCGTDCPECADLVWWEQHKAEKRKE